MCRNCGAIVGAGQTSCAVCGAPVAGQTAQPQRATPVDRETLRFARAVLNRPYKFTIILLAANFFVFLLMWQSAGMTSATLWEFSPEVLIAYGAKLNYLIREYHQWWRFVTPMFVHINLPHLLVNMYSLWIVGPYVEKLYGSAKFLFFWVVTGIVGVVASYLTVIEGGTPVGILGRFLIRTEDVPSAGASGALFGLVGVLFVFGIKFRHELPEGFKRAFGTGMLPIILINLFIGYIGRGFIDNGAHLGGLLSGAALASVVSYRRPGERKGVALVWRILQIGALGLLVVCFFKVARNFSPAIPWPIPGTHLYRAEQNQNFIRYSLALNGGQEAMMSVIHRRDSSAVNSSIKQLEELPPLDETVNQLKERLKNLLVSAKELNERVTTASDPLPAELQTEQNELVKELAAWTSEYNEWLATQGKNY